MVWSLDKITIKQGESIRPTYILKGHENVVECVIYANSNYMKKIFKKAEYVKKEDMN